MSKIQEAVVQLTAAYRREKRARDALDKLNVAQREAQREVRDAEGDCTTARGILNQAIDEEVEA